jgi:hypothetical protein
MNKFKENNNMTRVIYDNNGYIISQMQGSNLYTPIGIPYIDIEIPTNKVAVNVDVSVTPHIAILADIPKSNLEILQETVDALILASLEG